MPSCPECGFDGARLSPPDAVVALRSLPRRFRAAVRPTPDDEPEPEAVDAALDAAGTAAAELDGREADLRRVLIDDTPSLPTREAAAPGDRSTALDRLAAAAAAIAELAESQPASAWTRTGLRAGVPVSAADLLREAVHAGVHQLRLAERATAAGA